MAEAPRIDISRFETLLSRYQELNEQTQLLREQADQTLQEADQEWERVYRRRQTLLRELLAERRLGFCSYELMDDLAVNPVIDHRRLTGEAKVGIFPVAELNLLYLAYLDFEGDNGQGIGRQRLLLRVCATHLKEDIVQTYPPPWESLEPFVSSRVREKEGRLIATATEEKIRIKPFIGRAKEIHFAHFGIPQIPPRPKRV